MCFYDSSFFGLAFVVSTPTATLVASGSECATACALLSAPAQLSWPPLPPQHALRRKGRLPRSMRSLHCHHHTWTLRGILGCEPQQRFLHHLLLLLFMFFTASFASLRDAVVLFEWQLLQPRFRGLHSHRDIRCVGKGGCHGLCVVSCFSSTFVASAPTVTCVASGREITTADAKPVCHPHM